MFAYCLNNPGNYHDPSGNLCFQSCRGDIDPMTGIADFTGGGSVGRSCALMAYTPDSLQEQSLMNEDFMWTHSSNGFYEEETLSGSFKLLALSLTQFTLFSFDFTALKGSWELDDVSLSLMDLIYAEAAVSVGFDGINVGALVALWAPSVTIKTDIGDITLGAYVGTWGAKVEVSEDNIGWSFGFGAIGFSFGIQ
jgi:hypothetical protein